MTLTFFWRAAAIILSERRALPVTVLKNGEGDVLRGESQVR